MAGEIDQPVRPTPFALRAPSAGAHAAGMMSHKGTMYELTKDSRYAETRQI